MVACKQCSQGTNLNKCVIQATQREEKFNSASHCVYSEKNHEHRFTVHKEQSRYGENITIFTFAVINFGVLYASKIRIRFLHLKFDLISSLISGKNVKNLDFPIQIYSIGSKRGRGAIQYGGRLKNGRISGLTVQSGRLYKRPSVQSVGIDGANQSHYININACTTWKRCVVLHNALVKSSFKFM